MPVLSGILCLLAGAASAWHSDGHRRVAADALALLPDSVPAYFRAGAEAVAEAAVDPDVMKAPETPRLRDREAPEHFLDREELRGRALPELRSQYLHLLRSLRRDPPAVGYLPYAVIEGSERLTVGFAELRRWPEDPHIRAKTLLYAGWLAHYASDLCQPLHTTIHHDGRARADGSSPHTGFHQHLDALFEAVPFDRVAAVAGLEASAFADPWSAVLSEFDASHARVEVAYAHEAGFAPPPAGRPWPPGVVEFTAERYRASVRFVASLFLTAWERSAAVSLPGWLEREGVEGRSR